MGYEAKIIADSISEHGKRIITVQGKLPMIVWNELMTHRQFSRGSASARAIPVHKMLNMILEDPFIPDAWFTTQAGMQPGSEITDAVDIDIMRSSWLRARDAAHSEAYFLGVNNNITKEIANRLLGPFLWNECVITSTHWCNFFSLRCHPMAQRQIRLFAEEVRDEVFLSEPTMIATGDFHLPYIEDADIVSVQNNETILTRMSSARCARVSYVNQDGISSVDSDLKLYARLVGQIPRHGGALEHVAQALDNPREWSGNFMGWRQHRKNVSDECLTEYTYNGRTMNDEPSIGE